MLQTETAIEIVRQQLRSLPTSVRTCGRLPHPRQATCSSYMQQHTRGADTHRGKPRPISPVSPVIRPHAQASQQRHRPHGCQNDAVNDRHPACNVGRAASRRRVECGRWQPHTQAEGIRHQGLPHGVLHQCAVFKYCGGGCQHHGALVPAECPAGGGNHCRHFGTSIGCTRMPKPLTKP